MKVMTRDFGEVEVEEKDIVEFPQGIPGFAGRKEFVLVPVEDSPFIVLQSLEKEDLAFITVDSGEVLPGYEFEIDEQVEEQLKLESIEDVLVLNIATIRDKVEDMTLNLTAPLVINHREGLGKQVILDEEKYPLRFQMMSQKKSEEVGN
ncbi:MAG: flagellar assembly protein FliW [Bacillota bacterium]